MIKPVGGGKYAVFTADGTKRLGPPKSKQDAVRQLEAIEIAKKSRGK